MSSPQPQGKHFGICLLINQPSSSSHLLSTLTTWLQEISLMLLSHAWQFRVSLAPLFLIWGCPLCHHLFNCHCTTNFMVKLYVKKNIHVIRILVGLYYTIGMFPQILKIMEKRKNMLCGPAETFGKQNSADQLLPRNGFSEPWCVSTEIQISFSGIEKPFPQ